MYADMQSPKNVCSGYKPHKFGRIQQTYRNFEILPSEKELPTLNYSDPAFKSNENIALFLILFFAEFVRGAFLISFLPIYGEKALFISYGVIGMAITAHFLSDTGVKLAIGYLLNRFPVRLIICTSLLISAAGLLLMPGAHSPVRFVIASALCGVGISPVWIVCLSRVTRNGRGTQMGFLYAVWLVGMGLGPVVSNMLIANRPLSVYWLLVGMLLVSAWLTLAIKPQTKAIIAAVPFRRQLNMLAARLSRTKLLLPGMILQTMGAGMLLPILPAFAEKHLGLEAARYSLLLVIGGGCAVLALVPMGKWSDWIGRKWFLVFGFCSFAFALYALTLRPSFSAALLWAVVLGVSYAAVLPSWNALLAQYVPNSNKGLGWGVLSTVEGVGVMAGPVLGGFLAEGLGEAAAVLFSAALFAGIAGIYLLFPERVFGRKQQVGWRTR
jgi:MFS family permease